jgi:hypothetical protein
LFFAAAERLQRLLANRDFDGLAETIQVREKLVAELPEATHDHETARRLLELEDETQLALVEATRGVVVELTRLRTGRAGVRKYAPAQQRAGARADFSA